MVWKFLFLCRQPVPLQPTSVPRSTGLELAYFVNNCGNNCLRARINVLGVMLYRRASSRFNRTMVVLAVLADALRPTAPFPMLHGLLL
jgi:hypothetical protein